MFVHEDPRFDVVFGVICVKNGNKLKKGRLYAPFLSVSEMLLSFKLQICCYMFKKYS